MPRPADPRAIRYLDRATGRVEVERVFGDAELRFFYEAPLGRALTELVFSRPAFSRVYGWFKRRARQRQVASFVEGLGIDVSEAELPLAAYERLDDFFCRRLRAEARPIDPDPDRLLSPADGRTTVIPILDPEQGLVVKGSRASLSALLGEEPLAARYAGGAAVVVRLAPADYHRFHFPAAGVAGPARRFGGRLHSVHPIALASGAPSFLNRRHVTRLETERFGLITMLEVGAMVVGTIVQTYRPGPVAAGAEKGLFRFGGSTVILLLEPGRVTLDPDLHEANVAGLEVLVRVGARIGLRAQ